MVKITLETEPNAILAYAPGLKTNHPIMSTLGAHRVQLDRDREKCVTFYKEFLKQPGSTQSETSWVSEVSSGRRGGSG